MIESQKWAAFDVAEIRLELMISHYLDLVDQARQGSNVDTGQLAK